MLAFALQRFAQAVLLLFLASIAVFLLLRLIPGDPAATIAGANARPEQLEAVREEFGLKRPLVVQYGIWLGNVLHGDLGDSFVSRQPVQTLIWNRLPATTSLAVMAVIIALAVAFPTGILMAVKRGSWMESLFAGYTSLMMAVPTFWLGLLLLLFFGLRLGWLPMSGYVSVFDNPMAAVRHLLLPAVTLAGAFSAVLARMLGTSVREVMYDDYVRTARAKGLGERVVLWRHVLRNALIPVITVLGIQVGQLLGGAVITEAIFQWPGVGQLILQAINNRDYTVVQGTMLFLVAVFVLVNFLVDLSYGLLDPRIRAGK
ncbi:MAG TPA: ABC transporter permease [Thermomicrobiales bacterium]|jgi:peptide/nickel transport system permease protein|nr:ABC transporter permease [Thermomicrobiales bacterium]